MSEAPVISINYAEFVKSRFKTGIATADDIANKVVPSQLARLHAAMGLLGETIEAWWSDSRENLEEELGDLVFFHEAMGQCLWPQFQPGIGLGSLITPPPGGAESIDVCWCNMVKLANVMHDLSKKEAIYAKELDADQMGTYASAYNAFAVYLDRQIVNFGFTLQGLRDSNIAKLTKRYKTGYSNEAAAERADKPAGE